MSSDTRFRLQVSLQVGPLAPAIVKHVKEKFLKNETSGKTVDPGEKKKRRRELDLEEKILRNFVQYKTARMNPLGSKKEIIISLYNTLKFASEYVMLLHGEKYNDDMPDRFVNQAKRALQLGAGHEMTRDLHEDLQWVDGTWHQVVEDGKEPGSADVTLFENKVKHYLRLIDPDLFPKQNS